MSLPHPARILAIETSGTACSAALYVDGDIQQRYALAPRQHAALILPMIESLLLEAGIKVAQLDALAFGRGPGSFTGVRIAASVVQGIAFAAELPVVPVSTLAALALGAMRESGEAQVLAALDARKHEIYWGAYRHVDEELACLQGEERVCLPENIAAPQYHSWVGAGSGWAAYGPLLLKQAGERVQRVLPDLEPLARDVARLAIDAFRKGRVVSPEQACPVYLRNNVADPRTS
jgi:tRNA threonylcarbamoyladenosine biosynthesis protein TsaB